MTVTFVSAVISAMTLILLIFFLYKRDWSLERTMAGRLEENFNMLLCILLSDANLDGTTKSSLQILLKHFIFQVRRRDKVSFPTWLEIGEKILNELKTNQKEGVEEVTKRRKTDVPLPEADPDLVQIFRKGWRDKKHKKSKEVR